jgi:2-furoate---CoA ligase
MFDLGTTFLASVERRPKATAIVDGDLRLTYAEWFTRIAGCAGGIAKLGLKKGDHLLVLLQNRWEAATLHWACQFLGVIITPLNWRTKGEELSYCATDAAAKAVVYESVSSEAVAALHLPKIALGEQFNRLIEAAPPPHLHNARAEDWSLMLYTSGTTGRPKGVPRRHLAERAAALAHVAQNLYGIGERTLGVLPLSHTRGGRSLLSMALIDGCFVCMPKWDAARASRLLREESITNLYLVPTLYHDLLACPAFDKGSVTKVGFAGAPMHDALVNKVHEAFNPQLFVNHYGSSEIYSFTIDQRAAAKPGSAGRAAFNTRIRVVRLDARQPDDLVGPGEEGQIIADLNGDEAFEGYWNRPDADAKALRDGWYFTGDTGYIDEDGDLFVTGRVDDMIISGGENISPVDIESVLSLHPAVDEVAVAGIKDERWGQRVVAFVKKRAIVDAVALDDHCRKSDLIGFKRPREYIFVHEVPKSPVGKILRRKLVAGEYEKE